MGTPGTRMGYSGYPLGARSALHNRLSLSLFSPLLSLSPPLPASLSPLKVLRVPWLPREYFALQGRTTPPLSLPTVTTSAPGLDGLNPAHIGAGTAWAHPAHICAGTGWAHPLPTSAPGPDGPNPPTSALGLDGLTPRPHLRRDCMGPPPRPHLRRDRMGSPRPHLRRDRMGESS
jgi:hypothetical protein